ncbi:dCTP deaminase [Archangium gephyra]|uniref:dCTP deaminase n=1 Tax=Archangium gephyra TaxID=48 RepID=UPI0035D3E4B8
MVLTHQEITQLVKDKSISRPNSEPVLDSISVTLHLGNQFAHYQASPTEPFVPPMEMPLSRVTLDRPEDGYVLQPNGTVLASSEEIITMPLNLMGLMQTRSSLARGFLMAHPCAGHIEPGYKGVVTFELVNFSNFHYKLIPGMPIAKLFFMKLAAEATLGYQGRYQNSTGPMGMKSR